MKYLMARTVRVMGRIDAASVVSVVDSCGWVQIVRTDNEALSSGLLGCWRRHDKEHVSSAAIVRVLGQVHAFCLSVEGASVDSSGRRAQCAQ